MKRITSCVLLGFLLTVLTGCTPGTPGTGMFCGGTPDPVECPNAKCVCQFFDCGWYCPPTDEAPNS